MASYWFNEGVDAIAKKLVEFAGSDVIKARLLTGALPARTITSMSGLTGVGADETLGTKSIVQDDTNHQIKFVAANPTFAARTAGSTITNVVVFKYGTGDADSIPLCCHDVADTATNGGDITIDWPTVNSQDGVVMYTTQS